MKSKTNKPVTIEFQPEFLARIDEKAKEAGFGRRNDYIKAVLRKDVYADLGPLPIASKDVK